MIRSRQRKYQARKQREKALTISKLDRQSKRRTKNSAAPQSEIINRKS